MNAAVRQKPAHGGLQTGIHRAKVDAPDKAAQRPHQQQKQHGPRGQPGAGLQQGLGAAAGPAARCHCDDPAAVRRDFFQPAAVYAIGGCAAAILLPADAAQAHPRRSRMVEEPVQAIALVMDWIHRATHSRIKPLVDFGKNLRGYVQGIIAAADFKINTSVLEGVNNKIKQIKRRAYGLDRKSVV